MFCPKPQALIACARGHRAACKVCIPWVLPLSWLLLRLLLPLPQCSCTNVMLAAEPNHHAVCATGFGRLCQHHRLCGCSWLQLSSSLAHACTRPCRHRASSTPSSTHMALCPMAPQCARAPRPRPGSGSSAPKSWQRGSTRKRTRTGLARCVEAGMSWVTGASQGTQHARCVPGAGVVAPTHASQALWSLFQAVLRTYVYCRAHMFHRSACTGPEVSRLLA